MSLGQAVDAVRRAEREIGLPAGIHGAFQGPAQAFIESLKSDNVGTAAKGETVFPGLASFTDSEVFIDDAGILDGHFPAAEVDQACAEFLVRFEESSAF